MSGEKNFENVLAQIEKNGRAEFYTRGFSMLPMLKEGRDISVLVPVNRALKRGDVVMFVRKARENELVLHRIIRFCGDGSLIIRGDNTYRDEPVKAEDVKALLEGFFRKGRYYNCEKSLRYRTYGFFRVFLYPVRRFFCHTLRIAGAKIKNNVFHLNNLHLDNLLGKNRSNH